MPKKLTIFSVNSSDVGGGAAKIATNLHSYLQQQGHNSLLCVGKKTLTRPDIINIPNDSAYSFIERVAFAGANAITPFVGRIKGMGFLKNVLKTVTRPQNTISYLLGREPFYHPGSHRLLTLSNLVPDIIHCHNLHNNYFDIRQLPSLSHKHPLVITLHDAWLLSGHCAHSFDCSQWKTGCNACPYLDTYPKVLINNTHTNWLIKAKIYKNSRLHIITPCQWLMDKVEQSTLIPGLASAAVINNGVNLKNFTIAHKQTIRQQLGLNQNSFVTLFVADAAKKNPWKDYQFLSQSMKEIASLHPEKQFDFITIGEGGKEESFGNLRILFVAPLYDEKQLAMYYQAANCYVHAAKADTFPTVILEALACGLPIIATLVDGISEQIKTIEKYGNSATGIGVQRGNRIDFVKAIDLLIRDREFEQLLANNAYRDARERFDGKKQMAQYLNFYYKVLEPQNNIHKPPKYYVARNSS